MEDPKEAAELLPRIYNDIDAEFRSKRVPEQNYADDYFLSYSRQQYSSLAISGNLQYRHPLIENGIKTIITDNYTLETVVEPIEN